MITISVTSPIFPFFKLATHAMLLNKFPKSQSRAESLELSLTRGFIYMSPIRAFNITTGRDQQLDTRRSNRDGIPASRFL